MGYCSNVIYEKKRKRKKNELETIHSLLQAQRHVSFRTYIRSREFSLNGGQCRLEMLLPHVLAVQDLNTEPRERGVKTVAVSLWSKVSSEAEYRSGIMTWIYQNRFTSTMAMANRLATFFRATTAFVACDKLLIFSSTHF